MLRQGRGMADAVGMAEEPGGKRGKGWAGIAPGPGALNGGLLGRAELCKARCAPELGADVRWPALRTQGKAQCRGSGARS